MANPKVLMAGYSMNEIPFTVVLAGLEIAFVAFFVASLRRAGLSGLRVSVISIGFMLWLITDYQLLAHGFFSGTHNPQWAFTAVLGAAIVLGFAATRMWAPLRDAIAAMATEDFLRLQTTRSVFGAMFFFTGALPAWFQYVGGLGDIVAGGAAFVGLGLLRWRPEREGLAIVVGNLPGILDFVVTLNLGVIVLLRDHTPDMPFDLIPLFVVPIYCLLHLFSLARLGSVGRAAAVRWK